jgi:hypothetical protein
MISKVWSSEYGRRATTGSPYQQALRRQWHYKGLTVFYYQEVLDFLPFLLYSAIMMFMVGICDWLYGIHKKIALYLILTFSFSFVFAVTLTFFSLVLPEYYPFRVPLADVIVRMAINLFFKVKAKAETLVLPSWFPMIEGKNTKLSLSKLFWTCLQTLWVFFELIWVALVMFPGFCRTLPQRCANLYHMFLNFFAPRDAFGSAMARKPVDDSYSSLEVEALAWLVKASSQGKLVNTLLKQIPTTVSTFERRRKLFLENGALDRLSILFEHTFQRDCEGPYPCVFLGSGKQLDEMMQYGFAIYSLCTSQTFPAARLSSEMACLKSSVQFSHKILGLALETCKDLSFYLDPEELKSLVTTGIDQYSKTTEAEREMLFGLVLRAISAQKIDSSDTCALICGLIRIGPLTSRAAALFCQALHHLIFQQENAHVLYDYNPALFAYHLSVHCVPFIVTFPASEAASYSIIMMQIIQCLCNNEAQLELGAQSQVIYGSFICSAMLIDDSGYEIDKEGLLTLLALSRKKNWAAQYVDEIFVACHTAVTKNQNLLKQSLEVIQSLEIRLDNETSYDAVKALVFYLKETINSQHTSQKINSIFWQICTIADDYLNSTFTWNLNWTSSSASFKLFRHANFPELHDHLLPTWLLHLSEGFDQSELQQMIDFIEMSDVQGRSRENAFSLLHALCLFSGISTSTSFLEKVISFANNPMCSTYLQTTAVSMALLLWNRAQKNSMHSTSKQREEHSISELLIKSRILELAKTQFQKYISDSTFPTATILWESFNWLDLLGTIDGSNFHQQIVQSQILDTMKMVLGALSEEEELVWMDKLEPTRFVISVRNLQSRLDSLESLIHPT